MHGDLARVGVDTGGTFTDCVLVDDASGQIVVAKVPSSPAAPHTAITDGLDRLRADVGDGTAVASVTHGTTVATNALLTGDVARVGLITNRGSRDVIEIGTQMRPLLYALRQTPRRPLVDRHLRLEVAGRIAADGSEVEPLDEAAVAAVCDQLVAQGVDAIAVACLFSFVNAAHEQRIQEIVAARAPGVYVGRSSAISQEPREYPRFATAVVNALLAPRLDPYIRRLAELVTTGDETTRLFIMQSNGGVGTAERSVAEHAHQLALSGPAAGVIGGAREAAAAGFRDCVTFDVGGTSADVAIAPGGHARTSTEMLLPNGVPCKVANVEIETIGAGGGSIAAVDAGGRLSVGPASAGADPGPACYGRGGLDPTVTDAQLVLGRLAPRGLIGGDLPLDPEAARAALATIGDPLGLSVEDAALGVLAVVEENMAGAIRRAAAAHGDDLRDFALVAGGGAGPFFAAGIIGNLGMPAAVIPAYPGLLSALGLLGAPIRHDLAAPCLFDADQLTGTEIERMFAPLEHDGDRALAEDGVEPDDRSLARSLDIRYLGQEYAVSVPLLEGDSIDAILDRFHELHETTFGHAAPGTPAEIVAARLVATGARPAPDIRRSVSSAPADPIGTRDVRFAAGEPAHATRVFDRDQLAADQVVVGPALLEQLDSTTLVPPGFTVRVHASGSLILTAQEDAR